MGGGGGGRGGEQTTNRDAKTARGIKFFASDESAILKKWTLKRSTQAESTATVYRLADVKSSNDDYKSSRLSRILSSERHVQRLLDVLPEEYVNPLDSSLDNDCLYNLSSGIAIDTELTDRILMTQKGLEKSLILLLWKTDSSLQVTKFIIQ